MSLTSILDGLMKYFSSRETISCPECKSQNYNSTRAESNIPESAKIMIARYSPESVLRKYQYSCNDRNAKWID